MNIWFKPFNLDDLDKLRANTLDEHLGIEFTAIGQDFLSAKMPVDQRTKQPFGIMHGGASCVLAETIASVAASFCIDLEKKVCVGLEINTSHIRMASSGYVVGTAHPLHIGQSTHLWEIKIVNESGQLISASRLRLAILDRKKA